MALINDIENAADRRNAIKVLIEEGKWLDLYGYKLDRFANLADLVDKDAAIQNLGLDNRYIQIERALYGRDPGTIHHTMIRQTTDARFVSDNQVRYWNGKISAKTGTANFAGLNRETTITHGIVDSLGAKVNPVFCSYIPNLNPGGCIGEVWMRWDNTHLIVGNSGSYTGTFTWVALF